MFTSLSQLLGFDAPTAPRKALAPLAANQSNQSNQSRQSKPLAKPPGKIRPQPSTTDATPSRVPRRATFQSIGAPTSHSG